MSDVSIGVIKVCKGATAAEQWISAEALAAMPEPLVEEGSKPPSVYYNGMIAPMRDYAFKGALWCQGEGNSRTHDRQLQYTLVKQTWIESWREQWGFDFPFIMCSWPLTWILCPSRQMMTRPASVMKTGR